MPLKVTMTMNDIHRTYRKPFEKLRTIRKEQILSFATKTENTQKAMA